VSIERPPEPPREYRVIARPEPQATGIPGPPVHILSALATIALDAIWGAVELGDAATVVGIAMLPFLVVLTFIFDFIAVFAIQKFVAKDGVGPAFAKALVLAILAGVPFMVMGTAAGAFLLGWAGLSNLTSRLGDGKH
jgi:hypothetical protein